MRALEDRSMSSMAPEMRDSLQDWIGQAVLLAFALGFLGAIPVALLKLIY